MRIVVVGAGGVGAYFGGRLALAGHDVTFIARGATLAALRSEGLKVDSIKGDFRLHPVSVSDDPKEVGRADAVLVAVKSWQVPEVAPALAPLLGPDTVVVPLENGLDAPNELISALGDRNVAGGLSAIVSFVVTPGHVRHIGADPMIMLGELDRSQSSRTERLRDALAEAGITVSIPPDIHQAMWTKFLFITPMSGIGAISRVPIGVWRSTPETRALAERAVREIIALAGARGIQLEENALEKTMARYDGLQPDSTASLQRDVMQGKPSELEAQVGAVVRMAAESGVAVPIHETIYAALLPQERSARGGSASRS